MKDASDSLEKRRLHVTRFRRKNRLKRENERNKRILDAESSLDIGSEIDDSLSQLLMKGIQRLERRQAYRESLDTSRSRNNRQTNVRDGSNVRSLATASMVSAPTYVSTTTGNGSANSVASSISSITNQFNTYQQMLESNYDSDTVPHKRSRFGSE